MSVLIYGLSLTRGALPVAPPPARDQRKYTPGESFIRAGIQVDVRRRTVMYVPPRSAVWDITGYYGWTGVRANTAFPVRSLVNAPVLLQGQFRVGILGAIGRHSRLLHYHETSGLAQTREESVNTS